VITEDDPADGGSEDSVADAELDGKQDIAPTFRISSLIVRGMGNLRLEKMEEI